MKIENYSSDIIHLERYLAWLLIFANVLICYLVFKYTAKGKTKNSVFYNCMLICLVTDIYFFKGVQYAGLEPIPLPHKVFAYFITIFVGGSSYYFFDYIFKNKFLDTDD
jgi:hypothetical protein